MKTHDLADLLRPYAEQWVALSWEKDRILASGSSLPEVVTAVKSKGYAKPVFTFVSDPRYGFLPGTG